MRECTSQGRSTGPLIHDAVQRTARSTDNNDAMSIATPPLRHVLVVEDDEDVAALLGAYLRRLDCTVTLANSGELGVEAARSRPPDVAIVDILLPGINGWEVIARLSNGPGGTCKMVSMSVADFDEAEHPGVLLRLPKPFTWADVKRVVEPLLN